ncbi:MAG: hypothetical protein WC791_01680 [Candidatus Paceibacterota bacterium]|jgi:hypothetical protein
MNKRILIIFIIIILALFGGGAYWYFTQRTTSKTPVTSFPSGSTSTPSTGTQGTAVQEEPSSFTPTEGKALPRLYQLHTAPVAGVGFAETKDKKGNITNITARYIERGLGNIFETQLSNYSETRLVNETRPHLSEALWGNNGNSVVVRFVDDVANGIIKSRIVNILPSASSSVQNISGGFLKTEEVYLPDSLPFIALAEDHTDNLFYLEGEDGLATNFKNLGVSNIFSSVFTEWLPQFPNQTLITLTSRPSANIPGHLFFLNPKTKAVTKILGSIKGLTTLTSHDGKFVLFSETKDSAPQLSVYDVAKKISFSLYVRTLPEKCVWKIKDPTMAYCAVPKTIQKALYPDQWYQGLISFSDEIWEINTSTFSAHKILSPSSLGAPSLDMTNLSISSDDSYLLFTSKLTGAPWLYSLIERSPFQQTVVATTPTSTTSTSTKTVPPSVISPDMQKLK